MRAHNIFQVWLFPVFFSRSASFRFALVFHHRFEGGEPELEKWSSEVGDVRKDTALLQVILNRMREHGVRSVVMPERIIGCPHEEGIDYPEGQACPQCDFWRGRNRFTGEYEL